MTLPNEHAGLKLEAIKQLYDSLKHMTTLSTGSLVLVVAFLEKLFKSPEWKGVVVAAVILLIITLFFSVSGMFFASLGIRDIEDRIDTKWPERTTDFMGWAYYTFFLGVALISAFFVKNFL